MSQAPHAHVSPEPIFQMVYGMMPAQLLKTGVSLEVFTQIAAGKQTAAALAEATGAVERNLTILLDALSALKLLEKPDAHTYTLSPVAETFLVKGKPTYMGEFTFQTEVLWSSWGRLEQTVREGLSFNSVQEMPDMTEMFKTLVPQLFPVAFPHAMALAGRLGTGRDWQPQTLLDVASGAAPWGIAFAKQAPDLKVTAWDFPAVLDVTREYTARFGVADQFDYLAGDIWVTEAPEQHYDVAILGHICHGYGPEQNQELFKRMHKALKPGGRLLIAEFIPDDDRRSAVMPLLFAANMMANTPEGNSYTLPEYSRWLADAGFSQVELLEIPPFPGGVISAVRE